MKQKTVQQILIEAVEREREKKLRQKQQTEEESIAENLADALEPSAFPGSPEKPHSH